MTRLVGLLLVVVAVGAGCADPVDDGSSAAADESMASATTAVSAQTSTSALAAGPATTTTAVSAPSPLRSTGTTSTYSYGPNEAQLVDLTLPADRADGPAPVVVSVKLDGWTSGSRAVVTDVAASQLDRGWALVTVETRHAPEHPYPATPTDIDRLIRWLHRYGPALGLDAERIVLVGSSSSGHLVLAAAAAPGRWVDPDLPDELQVIEPVVAGVVALAAPADLGAIHAGGGWGRPAVGAYLGCGEDCTSEELAEASVPAVLTSSPPEALVVFGELDTLVVADDHRARLADAWTRAGGTITIDVAPGVGHNLSLAGGVDPAVVNAFFDRVSVVPVPE